MKIIRTVYTLESTTAFDQIDIYHTENGFSYSVSVPRALGYSQYMVFKNCLVGAFGYVKEKENFDKNIVETFDSIDECFASIKNLSKKKIDECFSEPIAFGRPLFAYINHDKE